MVGAIAGPVARTNRLVSAGRSAPRARSLGIEVHVEPRRLDRVDPPSFGEAVADLLFGDAPRSPVARFLLAEAKHEVAAARRNREAEALHEPGPIVVVGDVEQPAVEDGVELLAQGAEIERVPNEEPDVEVSFPCLPLRDRDGGRRAVDPRCPEAETCR